LDGFGPPISPRVMEVFRVTERWQQMTAGLGSCGGHSAPRRLAAPRYSVAMKKTAPTGPALLSRPSPPPAPAAPGPRCTGASTLATWPSPTSASSMMWLRIRWRDGLRHGGLASRAGRPLIHSRYAAPRGHDSVSVRLPFALRSPPCAARRNRRRLHPTQPM
jgi:hypothetical protein